MEIPSPPPSSHEVEGGHWSQGQRLSYCDGAVRVTIHARDFLLKDSQVLVAQPQTLPHSRLSNEVLTHWTEEERQRVGQVLRAILLT